FRSRGWRQSPCGRGDGRRRRGHESCARSGCHSSESFNEAIGPRINSSSPEIISIKLLAHRDQSITWADSPIGLASPPEAERKPAGLPEASLKCRGSAVSPIRPTSSLDLTRGDQRSSRRCPPPAGQISILRRRHIQQEPNSRSLPGGALDLQLSLDLRGALAHADQAVMTGLLKVLA